MPVRSDPYQDRARELACTAGLNPDARIAVPGKPRGMPAWCQFRDQARAEQVARETAEAAASIAGLAPQPPEFQNSPLMVFGEHDDSTIAQMRNCMGVGNVVAGVICADGHLGYAQPVGGVIAYENQISISGVGFDISCFTGDTRIFTLDGKHPTLAELAGRETWVLSSTAKGEPRPARATAALTRRAAALVAVTLDNGRRIRCTPDHLFMLRNGSYAKAADLAPNQSLMPFYTTLDKDGYVLVRNSRTRRLLRLHWLVFHAGLTKPRVGSDAEELVVHHEDFDRANNDPGNLTPMGKAAHDAMHAAMRDRAHFNSPEFTVNRIAAIKRFWETARLDDVFMEKRRETVRTNVANVLAADPSAFKRLFRGNGRRGAEFLLRHNRDPATIRKNRARAGQPRPCPLCGEIMTATSSLYYHALKVHPDALAAGTRAGRHRGRNQVTERLALGADNHKVVSVERLSEREDVYCLTVPGLNNFALLDGVFVHNCGNKAVQLDLTRDDLGDRVPDILREISTTISFGIGRTNDERVDHELFDDDAAWQASGMEDFRQKARAQLGTVGCRESLRQPDERRTWLGLDRCAFRQPWPRAYQRNPLSEGSWRQGWHERPAGRR